MRQSCENIVCYYAAVNRNKRICCKEVLNNRKSFSIKKIILINILQSILFCHEKKCRTCMLSSGLAGRGIN